MSNQAISAYSDLHPSGGANLSRLRGRVVPISARNEGDFRALRAILAPGVEGDIPSGIARVLFTVFEGDAILLHGFIKKGEKTPLPDLKTARQRKKLLK